jgi:hypothetical protein
MAKAMTDQKQSEPEKHEAVQLNIESAKARNALRDLNVMGASAAMQIGDAISGKR